MTSWKHGPAHRVGHSHRRAGQVFWLDAGATWMNQDKPRPFVLANAYSPDLPATLVYGSTQETEKRIGAACVEVNPVAGGVNRNGLTARTYFYPGALLLAHHPDLPPHVGFLGRSLSALRAALRTALGIGRGSCLSHRMYAGSRRGRIVLLAGPVARLLHTRFAIVLTEPRYSARKKYQLVVPVLRATDAEPDENHLRIFSPVWRKVWNQPTESALLPIALTMSVWQPDHVARETEYVVDDDTLAEIDRRLCEYFLLPPMEDDRRAGR